MLDTTKENTNDILLNNEDDAVKPSLLSFSCVRMKKEQTKILLRSAPKPKYRSAEKVKVSLALIIEEAAVQRDCTQTRVHSGKDRGTQLETGRYEGKESCTRKPVADLV